MRKRFLLLLLLVIAGCRKTEAPAALHPEPAFRNLLLITIDTLRADALPMYGGKTPAAFLESFSRSATVFENAFTSAPITLPSHTSLMSGLYPPSHGVRNNGTFHASDSLVLLAEYAKQHGMKTGAVIGGYPLASQYGLNQGFDFYDDSFPPHEFQPGIFLYAERNAELVRLSAEKWLSANSSPYFLWLHFFDPHHPYNEHGFDGLSPYQQEIAYVDQRLAMLFDFLKSRKLDEKTLIIITADHGEAFGEHGEVSHSLFVYNTTLHVPLIISGPGIPSKRITNLVRLIDVLPTILDAFQWKAETKMDGASILPLLQGSRENSRENYAETFAPAYDFGWSPLASLQDLHYKYIRAPRPEFYNLQTDPSETKPLSEAPESYRDKISQILAHSSPQDTSHSPTPEEREKLKSLGYFSGGISRSNWNAPDPKDRVQTANELAELAASSLPLASKAKAYEKIAAAEPSNPLLLLRYGEILLKLNRYAEAQKVFQHAIDLEYPSPSVYNGMATALFYQDKLDAAENILKQAVKIGTADGETHYNLGEFLFNQGDRKQAMLEYDRAISLRFARAFYRKARLLDLMGQQDAAIQLLQDAESKFPLDMQANFDQGIIAFRRRDFSTAAKQFEEALKKDPRETEIHYNLGVAYLRLGNNEAARDHLQHFLRDAPPTMAQQKAEVRELLKSM